MTTTPEFEELVTRALPRVVHVPGLDRPAVLITLDNGKDHTKPNTFGPGGVASLDAAITEAFAADPAFIAITGKPFVFSVGADLNGIGLVRTREQVLLLAREGHRVFARLRDSTVPTFAFLNGAALGGGLELALHCHYRTVSSSVTTIALPEVGLGLVPAWGGTQLLPKLIGIVDAATVIVQNPLQQNRMLRAQQAFEMGIADALIDSADYLERSLEWAASVVRGQTTVTRRAVETKDWDDVIAFARAMLDEKLHGAAHAPYRALDLLALAKDTPFAAGTAAEDEALADLVMGEQMRSSIYAFNLVQRRARRPVGAPDTSLARPVTKVGIVGAGLMASQLGLLFAQRLEAPVVLTDLDQERVDKGLSYVHGEIDKLAARGRLSQGRAAKLHGLVSGSVDKAGFADADLVVEAVFEQLDVKKRVFAEVEQIVEPDCILATNTSSLSVTAMAADLAHPERVVGLHFFNPVALMPLLEVVRAKQTDDGTLATAFAVGRTLRKSCVLVSDAPAFVVNRLLTRFQGAVFAAIESGTPVAVADAALDPMGLPMRPLALLDLVGPAVAYHVASVLHAAFPDRFAASENLRRIAESGLPVLVDGKPNPELESLLEVGDNPLPPEQVLDNALSVLAEEVRLMLDEGVVAQAQDIDLCLLLGAGFPFHLGGITPYLDRTGVSERVTGARFLPPGVASLPA